LDCLAYGLPTIINAHGSFNDYPDDCVVKLPESPNANEIADAIIRILLDKEYRVGTGRRAKLKIIEDHHPEKIARSYAEVISKAICEDERKVFEPLVDTAITQFGRDFDFIPSARYAAQNADLRCQPRLLVDVTGWQDQPEICQMVQGLVSTGNRSIHIELVEMERGQITRCSGAIEKVFSLPEPGIKTTGRSDSVLPGDILIITPYSREDTTGNELIMKEIKEKGGKVFALFDRAPLGDVPSRIFTSDAWICLSFEVAEKLAIHFDGFPKDHQHQDIYYSSAPWGELASLLLGEIGDQPLLNRMPY
jgi:hypothetical protein